MNLNYISEYRYLISAVLNREFILFLRYPIDTIGLLLTHILFFGMIFIAGVNVAGQAMADSLEGIIVGYLLWMMASRCYQTISQDIQSEASWGTLERHFMTPYGFSVVMLAKSVAKLVLTFGYASVLLIAMMAMTRTPLHIDLITIVPITVLTLLSVFGVGFAMAGVTILYKKISNWIGLLQFAFIGLITAPVFGLDWAIVLPLAQGSNLLNQAMSEGIRLWEFTMLDLGILLGTGVVYFLIGYLLFYYSQRRARKLGVLGDY